MTSKEDDTLPLPGFSQEPSVDATVDEDFIPASQPQSSGNLKVPIAGFIKPAKELKCVISETKIDDTLPITDQLSMCWDKSSDFIPETETKKDRVNYATEDFSCKKKLAVFDPEDFFDVKSNPMKWDSDISKILESPALDTQNLSVLNDTSTERLSRNQETVKKIEESITEIIVNDSAETVDLEATPDKIKSSETVEKLKISCSLNSDEGKSEETQIFDNSSVLLLEQPGTDSLVLEKSETSAEKFYLQQTVDDNDVNEQDKVEEFNLGSNPSPSAAEMSGKSDVTEEVVQVGPKTNENSLPDPKVEINSSSAEPSSSSIAIRKIDFKLTVCETPKSKPKPDYVEHVSDNTSDKSKRYSTSSSGSVYSDQTGLPFALPKRVSAISDLTDSSEDDFSFLPKEERRALERVPWKNEYLLPLKLDDVTQVSIDTEELLKRPVVASPRKPKKKPCDGINLLKEILESSSSERTSFSNLGNGESQPVKTGNSEEVLEKETSKGSEIFVPNESTKPDGKSEENIQNEADAKEIPSGALTDKKDEETAADPPIHTVQPVSGREMKQIEEQTTLEEGSTSIRLHEGLPVFARWSDKRYYSGILSGNSKSDRWDVKFDDGTLKAVRKDFIMPSEWLKLGALVFALTDDRYESGQIVDIKMGEQVSYFVELDTAKKVVCVKMSDLCLTDVMAGIVREKYKPAFGTPRGIADIDFDNVLSGKRLREQRTPSSPAVVSSENSGTKKKSFSKAKKTISSSLDSVKKTPSTKNQEQKEAVQFENEPPTEGKTILTESQSENASGETPLRGRPKEPKAKSKPRSLSLSFAFQEAYPKKKISKSWVTPDGTPIPGPSGVRIKKQKASGKTRIELPVVKDTKATVVTRSSKKNLGRSKALQPTGRGRKKRKLDDSDEDRIQKKSLKEGESRIKTRIKKA